ncbi:MAG TPA: glutathione S-transferase family protein [Candidatus Binatia bacterium]|jgi:glutathione S-transferase|nr:glutathione S-transferase family protein [Candidatus Binatia bacterium]
MAIKLYDAVPSSNSDRVKIALHEKGLPYERVTLNLAKKDQKRPEFLKLNPYGKVPVIDEDGKVLFESCIINEYLDEKYPNPPLMPKDPYLRGRGRVLVDYALNYVHEPYWALRGEMLKPEAERDAAVVEEKRRSLQHLLQYLEEALGDKPYFLGDLTLTDIAIVPRFLRMETYGALPAMSLPRLGAWLRRMKERPSVKTIL